MTKWWQSSLSELTSCLGRGFLGRFVSLGHGPVLEALSKLIKTYKGGQALCLLTAEKSGVEKNVNCSTFVERWKKKHGEMQNGQLLSYHCLYPAGSASGEC